MSTSYEGVSFDFVSASGETESSSGKVLVRDDGMVLEVNYQPEDPYNIVGSRRNHYFRGPHVGSPSDDEVNARWAEIGDGEYVGVWVEDGIDWLFRFQIPR
jgi:hypothetical protein